MKDIFYFFIVFFKNLLKYVHKSIMQQMWPQNNPRPLDFEGTGELISSLFFMLFKG